MGTAGGTNGDRYLFTVELASWAATYEEIRLVSVLRQSAKL
jgi:hypothetical protein